VVAAAAGVVAAGAWATVAGVHVCDAASSPVATPVSTAMRAAAATAMVRSELEGGEGGMVGS
jgi:hypothetical protein